MSLQLTALTASQRRLAFNAQPTLTAIDAAILDLQAARSAFSADTDNRECIASAVHRLSSLTDDLLAVDDRDQEVFAAGQAFTAYQGRLIAGVHSLSAFASQVVPTEAETRGPMRNFKHSLEMVSADLRKFSERLDTRPEILASLAKVKSSLADLLVVDRGADRWVVAEVGKRCDSMAAILRESIQIRPALKSQVEQPANYARVRFADNLDELFFLLSGVSDAAAGGEVARSAIGKIRLLRSSVMADLYCPFEASTEVTESLESIRRNVLTLTRTASSSTPQQVEAMRSLRESADRQLSKLCAMAGEPVVSEAPPKTFAASLIASARGAFGWEEVSA